MPPSNVALFDGFDLALVSDAPVLVLVEPTAHLDPPTAKRLIEDVFAVEERCVFLITHRPEGIDFADELVVVPEGKD